MNQDMAKEFYSIMYRFRLLSKQNHITGDLSSAEFGMMLAIAQCNRKNKEEGKDIPGATISEMVEELGTTLPAGSKLLRSIEHKGYVSRIANENDRRVTYLKLTEKGETAFEQYSKDMGDMMKRVFCKMGEVNMKELMTQMQNLYKALKEELEGKE